MKKVIAITLVTLGVAASTRAQWIVYDPTSNIQQIIDTAQEIAKYVEMINNQVQQIQTLTDQLNQFKHYEEKVLAVYAQRIYEAVQKDGFYVRVPSGKQFYLYVLQTIDRGDAAIGDSAKPLADEDKPALTALQGSSVLSATPTPVPILTKSSSTPVQP
jgi:hypothetical protein